MAVAFLNGIGQFARPSDAKSQESPRVAPGRRLSDDRIGQRLAALLAGKDTAGIPVIFHEEGLHGYAVSGATSFPQAIR